MAAAVGHRAAGGVLLAKPARDGKRCLLVTVSSQARCDLHGTKTQEQTT